MKILGYEIKKIGQGSEMDPTELIRLKREARQEGYAEGRKAMMEYVTARDIYYKQWGHELAEDRQILITDQLLWEATKDSYVLAKLKEIGR